MTCVVKYFVFCLIFLFPRLGQSQHEVLDSLQIQLEKALLRKNHDTSILKLKHLIAWNLKGLNPDSSILISKEINKSIIQDYFKSSPKTFFSTLKEKKNLSKTERSYLTLLGDSYHALGVYKDIKGMYNLSLEDNFRALRIWDRLSTYNTSKYNLKKASSYGNIGILFEELGDNKRALNYFYKCLNIKNKTNDYRGVALTYGSIGTVYYNENKMDLAATYYQKALDLLLQEKDENNASVFIGNLAVIYMDKQDYNKAIAFLSEGLEIDRKLDKKKGEASKLGNIGFAYLKMKQYAMAEKYLTEALTISNTLKLNSVIPDHHLYLSELYENTNQDKKAFYHYKKYIVYLDSIKNDEVIRTQTRLQTEFEFEKKQEIQKKEQEKKEAILLAQKNKQIYINLLLISVIIIVLLIVFFVVNSIKKQKKQVELQAAKRQLEIEYKLLRTQMNPHFIFNVLNSIHQYINQVNNEQASNLLLKFSKLIRTILQHSTREEIPLNEEIDQISLYISIEELRFSNQFTSQITIDPTLQTDEILVPTMIIQPFIENAIVHGISTLKDRKGELKIAIQQLNETHLQIRIEDNGNGIFSGVKNKTSHESLSMKLIEERLKLLDSKELDHLKIEELNPGTRITVRIPYQTIY